MGSKCPKCGAEINDGTQDCPGCGYRVREERLTRQLTIATEAIEGWREANARLVGVIEAVNSITNDFNEALNKLKERVNVDESQD